MFFKILFVVAFAGILSVVSTEEKVSYEGFKVYKIQTKSIDDIEFLHSYSSISGFDFWELSKIVGNDVHVMVEPEKQIPFEMELISKHFQFTILVKNLQRSIETENTQQEFSGRLNRGITFTKYHRFADVNAYLEELAVKYPDLVTVKIEGSSHEGRSIKTIRISDKTSSSTNKKTIFMDAGVHAREWIAPATALYVINQLVENYENNKDLLKNLNWVILPVVNPDGYEYTHTGERLWRKTRKPNTGSTCKGTDGNRNFDFYWALTGSSSSYCSEIFHGSKAFSEPETSIVRDIMEELKSNCKFYLTLHSYGHYLLYPWGYTSSLPANWKDHHEVAIAGRDAVLQATGARYEVGSSTNVLYAAAGGSDDYAHGVKNIPISITMELPGGGSSGFDPAPSKIDGSVKESFIGIRAMALKVDSKFN